VREVSCKGDSTFNLFVIGIWLVNGWKLNGDADHVEVSEGWHQNKVQDCDSDRERSVILLYDEER
jgi:hypothetical protein